MLPIYRGTKVEKELLESLSKREVEMLLILAKGHNVGLQTKYKAAGKHLTELGILSMRFGSLRLSFLGQDVCARVQRMNGRVTSEKS